MQVDRVIYGLLTAAAGVTALVGTRIYPLRLPINTTLPAVAYSVISANAIPPISATAGTQTVISRVEVTVVAKNYAEVKSVLEAIRVACDYKSGTLSGVQVMSVLRESIGPDVRDDETNLYEQSMDFTITHYDT